ncbi:multiheme c-type cytochrome [Stratiformator vulcanicus]|uniref:Perchlorate reductase subunit gamma n=1 Tax=Stratiformator vulcanicus TaxID=2527980 RepID=A0A517R5L7_9PLAN|nr:multiheme c-type cytochrome [Stratiformator vulcanicus]QDT39181.1 Perchlorate reductase subunit gamma precursor [Stratiformator vulcanicus]
MARDKILILFALLGCVLMVAAVVYRGIASTRPMQPGVDGGSDPGQGGIAVPEAGPPFADWEQPDAVLLISSEQFGYLEPCGCSASQAGGMARRAGLFRMIKEKGWPLAAIDLGGTVKRHRRQSQFKFSSNLEALKLLDYAALGVGPEELKLRPDYLLSQNVIDPETGQAALPFLGANQMFFDIPDLDGGPIKTKVFEAGPVRFGVAQILGDSIRDSIVPGGSTADFSTTAPTDVLPDVIESLEAAEVDVMVLLSYATPSESTELAAAYPQFDIVVTARGPEDPPEKAEQIGDTLLLRVGQKGKHIGAVGVTKAEESGIDLKFELVELDAARFDHVTAMDEVMASYQTLLEDYESEVFADIPEGDAPPGGTYVGADRCGKCHTKAFAKWSKSRHAKAYHSLIEGRENFEGDWVPRNHDPECLSCHVTGWDAQDVFPFKSGFLPEAIASQKGDPDRYHLLKGQQCENCHGPGSHHSEVMQTWLDDKNAVPQPEFRAAAKEMKIELTEARDNLCIKCHDHENSPKFNFAEYWSKVKHSGLD